VYKKLLMAILILSLLMTLAACSEKNFNPKENEDAKFLTEPQVIVPIDLDSALH